MQKKREVKMLDEREPARGIKASMLFLLVLGFHVVAIGTFVVVSGCSTKQPQVDPPPAPVMPPRMDAEVTPVLPRPAPVFRPPVEVQPPATSISDVAQTYTVQQGDSLGRIAARHGISASELAALNNISNPNMIRIGQVLALPAHARPSSSPAPAAAAARPAAAAPAAVPAGGKTYTVVAGDNLTKIARAHGVTVSALRTANNLSSDVIRVGQKLVVPGASAPAAAAPAAATPAPAAARPAAAPDVAPAAPVAPAPAAPALDFTTSLDEVEPFSYVVKASDNLETISRLFGVLPAQILDMNNITEDQLTAGRTILIPWQD
ncbi:MAG TPA: LysM peptidoglycan-binding domain-containing protein [Kiritimatiellia bacterium]|nr:LysM peptidoglycan-binding domain-containing protein [Kiritimatiellia bacterium]